MCLTRKTAFYMHGPRVSAHEWSWLQSIVENEVMHINIFLFGWVQNMATGPVPPKGISFKWRVMNVLVIV